MSEKSNSLAHPAGIVRVVTPHALQRWMERTRCSSELRALRTLHEHLARAVEVQLAPKFRALALLEHDLKPARYFRCDAWIFVVSEDGALLTVHAGEAKRWAPIETTPKKKHAGRRWSR